MKQHLILTSNVFIESAFSHIFKQVCQLSPVCVIDCDSFPSLSSVAYSISRIDACDLYRFYLIDGKSVRSRLLSPLISINKYDSVVSTLSTLNRDNGVSFKRLMTFIKYQVELRGLSSREKQITYLAGSGKDLSAMARVLGIQPRTIYAQAKHVTDKLRLGNFRQVRLFSRNEFNGSRPVLGW